VYRWEARSARFASAPAAREHFAVPTLLVLASASPRRAELLRSAGLEFIVRPVDCDESWHAGESPILYVERVAAAKARAGAALDGLPSDALILAADTTVWLDADAEPLAKPTDRAHATEMLRALTRGRAHSVSTACAFARPGGSLVAAFTETTRVHMRSLSDAQFLAWIDPYLDAGDWSDKAGAYAIQGRAAALVLAIEGSYTGVVGLPLAQVVNQLEQLRHV
jgi:septum formation protein